MLQAVTPNPSL